MKILKYILLAILALVAIMLIVAAILPKDFHAGSEVTINQSPATVFDYVKQVKNQPNFDNWSRQDPNIQKEYTGTDATIGFTYTWKSDKIGEGKQVITKIDEGKRVEMDLFFNGSDDANKSFIQVDSLGVNQSKVTWAIDGKMPYPFNIMGLFFDMNKDFDEGLTRLKGILEAQ